MSLIQALSEEKLIYERSSTKPVYINLAIHTIRRIREEVPGGSQQILPFKQKVRTLSHEAVLGGPKATCTSFTVNRSSKLPSVPDKFNGR
jgi:RNA exonuclease 1